MTLDWQNLMSLGFVGLSAGYLVRRGWNVVRRKRGGCGACPSCPADSQTSVASKPLVTLQPLAPPRRDAV